MSLISHISILVLLFLCLIPFSFSERCHPNDKKALLQIKKDLNNSNLLISWKPKTDCCSKWFGIICDLKTNRIIRFRISQSDLRVPIPAAIGDLPYLENLEFYETNFTGQIPAAISKLSNLKSLDLRSNLLTGPIPEFLGNLKKLGFIGLSFNSLTGSIPASLSHLQELHSLFLNNNKLTGRIPRAISKLSNLNFLDLEYNLLIGPVPSFLGHLKKLTSIGLSFNSLTGSIPASLSQLPELRFLFLESNKLTGSVPESFADFKQKDFYLYLSNNRLSGPIPRKLGSASFTVFTISRNRLEGDLSHLFGKNKTYLFVADFSWNLFEFDFSKLVFPETLVNLNLNHNKIYGSIPKGLTKIHLISLNVSYNRLCGKIPVGGRLQDFDYTDYFHNKCLCGSPLPKCK